MIKPNTVCMIKIPHGIPFGDLSGKIVVTVKPALILGREYWNFTPPLVSNYCLEPVEWAITQYLYPLANPDDSVVDEISKVKENICEQN